MLVLVPVAVVVSAGGPVGVGVGMVMVMVMRMVIVRVLLVPVAMHVMGVIVMGVIVMGMIVMGMIVRVPVIVVVRVVPVVMAAIVLVGAAFRLEGPHHRNGRAALAAHHLGEHVIVLDIERVGGDFGRRVSVADMIGNPEEPQRVFGPDLQEPLRRGLHLDQPAVLELHRIAVGQDGGPVEVEQEIQAVIALQRHPAAVTALVVQGDGIDDAVGLDGRFADDGSGAQHDRSSKQEVALRHR
jgi:hypothetical protein